MDSSKPCNPLNDVTPNILPNNFESQQTHVCLAKKYTDTAVLDFTDYMTYIPRVVPASFLASLLPTDPSISTTFTVAGAATTGSAWTTFSDGTDVAHPVG